VQIHRGYARSGLGLTAPHAEKFAYCVLARSPKQQLGLEIARLFSCHFFLEKQGTLPGSIKNNETTASLHHTTQFNPSLEAKAS
jgi:hypothetical protein